MMSGFDTDNGASGLSHTQRRAIVLVAQACAAFSFMGSAVIVVANFRFKQVGLPLFWGVCAPVPVLLDKSFIYWPLQVGCLVSSLNNKHPLWS